MGVVSGYPVLIEVELSGASATGDRTIVETWLVKTDDASTDSIYTATNATGIPLVNSAWQFGNDFDFGVAARDYSTRLVSREESFTHWHVVITYRTQSDSQEDQRGEDDPINFAPIISGSGIRFSSRVVTDRNGDAVLNAAGDPWPDLEKDDFRPTLKIEKNFAALNLAQLMDFANSTNQNAFWGLQPETWKMSFPRWRQLFRGDRKYFNVVFEFEAKTALPDNDWKLRPLERGHFAIELIDGAKTKVAVKDSEGNRASVPMALNAIDGTQRAHDADPPYEPVFGPIEAYKVRDFALLGIPTTGP